MGACWQCRQPAGEGLFCQSCGSLQSPPHGFYEFLGLQPALQLDTALLQDSFYQLSRRLHPDRYSRKSEQERNYSLEATAILNDAYRTLRDPVSRAEYLLKRNGFDIGEQRTRDVPAELLEEVFELNMALEEVRHGDDSVKPRLSRERDRFLGLLAQVDAALESAFERYDTGGGRETLAGIRALLNRRRYITNLVDEVEKALE
jgi:molecular chaperone HscB